MISAPIRVSYISVAVEGEAPISAQGNQRTGAWIAGEHKILIRCDLPPAEQAATLMHELIHAIYSTYALKGRRLGEEDVCCQLEGPLVAVFTDNPWLAGVLHQAVNHGVPIVKPTLH